MPTPITIHHNGRCPIFLVNKYGFLCHETETSSTLTVPKELGSGYFRCVQLCDDLVLGINELILNRPIIMHYENYDNHFETTYGLQGHIGYTETGVVDTGLHSIMFNMVYCEAIEEGIMEMPKTKPFDAYSSKYERWFIENQNIYDSELNAIKSFIPSGLNGVEIGIGTGRFAKPLCIMTGIEPSHHMAEVARGLGIKVIDGVAENLPIGNAEFDFALMVTAICFFDDIEKAFREAHRVLKRDGFLIIAFIDKENELGILYEKNKQNSEFYKDATFYSVKEVTDFLTAAGFRNFEYKQTVFSSENILHGVEPGYGRGSFAVIKARK